MKSHSNFCIFYSCVNCLHKLSYSIMHIKIMLMYHTSQLISSHYIAFKRASCNSFATSVTDIQDSIIANIKNCLTQSISCKHKIWIFYYFYFEDSVVRNRKLSCITKIPICFFYVKQLIENNIQKFM